MMGRKKRIAADIVTYVALSLLVIFAVFPFLWQIMTALKTMVEITGYPTRFFPEKPTLDNFRYVLKNLGFLTYIKNSVLVSLLAMAVSMVISSFGAYSLVRFYPSLSKKFTRVLITTYMFPPVLLAIPFFIVISTLGIANTLTGLIVAYMSFTVPYCTWLLVGYFKSIPEEVEQAAHIDGASKLRVFFSISIPLSAPGIVATAIFAFINAWNEFLYSLILISSGSKKTVSVAIYSLVGGETLEYTSLMAVSALAVLPTVILFLFIQRRLAYGLTGGAIK
jgi:multiple sugar transport system permease protein